MNILAEEQKKIYEEGITEIEKLEREKEFLKLYYELREKEDKKFWSKLTLEQRQRLHWLILAVYKLKNRLGGFSCNLIKDERIKTERPIIFAVTHVGKFDIEVVSEAIKDHYYLLSGDYEHLQEIVDAPFLGLNGVFYFNEKVKEDRVSVTNRMIDHLISGGNLMYFPEGTWNLTPNLPVLPCYWGIIDVARKSNAIIIPVGADQVEKLFTVNIGKNFDVNLYENTIDGKKQAIDDLRDTLATLKWEIWESYGLTARKDLNTNEWQDYVAKRFEEWPYFNEKYIEGLIYKPKNVESREEFYRPVKKLVPNKNNAFLFNKRLEDSISY